MLVGCKDSLEIGFEVEVEVEVKVKVEVEDKP
jgi:hypothetical protein